VTESFKPAVFPVFKITGGPHGKNGHIEVDGVPLTRVRRVDITIDSTDVVRVKTLQFAEVMVEVEVLPENHTQVHTVVVYAAYEMGHETLEREELARSTADTIWEALYDCGRQLELQAKRDAGVAQAGTMAESSGRPPGHEDMG